MRARGARRYTARSPGYGSTCEAFHRVRLEECGEEPARAIGLALEEAGVPADAIDYIQYHGTSTELNDRIETRAVKLAFGDHARRLPGIIREEHARTSPGRVRGGGHCCDASGDEGRSAASDDQCRRSGPRMRSGLRADPGRKMEIEYAVANCIAFGSKNSALVLRRVHEASVALSWRFPAWLKSRLCGFFRSSRGSIHSVK